MKILLATPLYPPDSGGPSTYAKLLHDELPKRGIAVTVVTFGSVRHLPPGIRHLVYFCKLLQHAKGADIVYALDPVSVGLPASLVARLTGKKFLVRIPGDYAWEQGRQRFGVMEELDAFQTKKYGRRVERLRKVQRSVVRRAKKVVVPSDYMKRIVLKWGNSDVERIYSSISFSVPPELPKNRPQGFLVVTIARPVPWKGLEGLTRVVSKEEDWTLKIVNDLPYTQAMGWVKTADAFVINSTYEGLSHALIEAMHLGTPVVATNVGGNPELITAGENGLLIPPKDDEALYAALKNIEANPDAAHARAEKAKEKANHFSIDITIEQLVTLLKSI